MARIEDEVVTADINAEIGKLREAIEKLQEIQKNIWNESISFVSMNMAIDALEMAIDELEQVDPVDYNQ